MLKKMVMKNKSKSLRKSNISNRLSYTIIAVFAIILIAAGVYAITPMVAPNPGHTMADIAPGPCSAGQYLQWSGSQWNCAAPTATDTRFTITSAGLCYTAPSTCSLTTETCNSHKMMIVSLSCSSYSSSQLSSFCVNQCNSQGFACDGTQTSCSGGSTASYISATGFCDAGAEVYCNCASGSSYSQEHYTAAGQRCL